MTQTVTMPALSDTMGAGRLVKWTKKPGDSIKKGDVIAEVETDKAVMEVEAFQDGYLSGPLAAEGTEAPVGETIGYIADNLDELRRAESATTVAAAAPQPRGNGNAAATLARERAPISPVLAASMATQRSAAAHGCTLARIAGARNAGGESAAFCARCGAALPHRARLEPARSRCPQHDCERIDAHIPGDGAVDA